MSSRLSSADENKEHPIRVDYLHTVSRNTCSKGHVTVIRKNIAENIWIYSASPSIWEHIWFNFKTVGTTYSAQ